MDSWTISQLFIVYNSVRATNQWTPTSYILLWNSRPSRQVQAEALTGTVRGPELLRRPQIQKGKNQKPFIVINARIMEHFWWVSQIHIERKKQKYTGNRNIAPKNKKIVMQ